MSCLALWHFIQTPQPGIMCVAELVNDSDLWTKNMCLRGLGNKLSSTDPPPYPTPDLLTSDPTLQYGFRAWQVNHSNRPM